MPLTPLEMFRATMAHRKHEGFLFYAQFTEILEKKVRTDLRIPPGTSMEDHFCMRCSTYGVRTPRIGRGSLT